MKHTLKKIAYKLPYIKNIIKELDSLREMNRKNLKEIGSLQEEIKNIKNNFEEKDIVKTDYDVFFK
jgi:peptidoglycan hydrolase CwlO-like protein